MGCTSFSVDLLVVTRDQLRKIDIGLAKDLRMMAALSGHSILGYRKGKKPPTRLQIYSEPACCPVKPALNDKAEATANDGLDSAQSSAAIVAADTGKAFPRRSGFQETGTVRRSRCNRSS